MILIQAARFSAITFAAALAGLAAAPAMAEDYYAGKTIDYVVGGNPGGGYDIYSRTVARHINRFIPGNPAVIVKNLPGAGSTKAATFIATVAPKDGTVIGAVFPGAIMDPLLSDRKPKYDPTKFHYLGTADSGTRLCVTWHTSKTKTLEDAQNRKTILGASQAGGSTRDYAYMHNALNGTKFEVVSGYKGSVDILLAMERGEVEGLCGWDWSSLRGQRPEWLRDKKLNIILQVAVEPEPALTKMGVPTIWKYIKNDEDKKVAELIVSQQIFGRPYILPPGTPPEQVKILRAAFDKTTADPQTLEEAKKSRIDIEPLGGAKVQEVVNRLFSAPKPIIDRAKAVIKPPAS
jgi:tripartite-type tricarboxylate transporter receptor subunit TctC